MNINPNRMSTLTELFSDLDDEYQGKLLYMAYKYKVEQQVKKELREKNKSYAWLKGGRGCSPSAYG